MTHVDLLRRPAFQAEANLANMTGANKEANEA